MLSLTISFDNSTKMENITKEIGISPKNAMDKKENRKNPFYKSKVKPEHWSFKGKRMPAFWTIETGYIQTTDFEEVVALFIDNYSAYFDNIKNISKKYLGEVHFNIVTKIRKKNFPALFFDTKFIDLVNLLNATFEINMYFD
jgi:hypothetical protein